MSHNEYVQNTVTSHLVSVVNIKQSRGSTPKDPQLTKSVPTFILQ